jgi:hypothetical protein
MYSVAVEIWNRIAADQELATRWAREVFRLDGKALEARLVQMHLELSVQKVDELVQLAYLTVMPLLEEHEAIAREVDKLDDPGLQGALPEVLTVSEAVRLMVMDYRLTPQKQGELRRLLETGADRMWMAPAKA